MKAERQDKRNTSFLNSCMTLTSPRVKKILSDPHKSKMLADKVRVLRKSNRLLK